MRCRLLRIAQEYNHINEIIGYLSCHLLLTAQVPRQKFMYIKIRNLLYKTPRGACRIERMLREDALISYAEILHKLLLGIMCYKTNLHDNTLSFFIFSMSAMTSVYCVIYRSM